MKEFIVIIASVMLGVYIFGLIAGDKNSIRSKLSEVWQSELSGRSYVVLDDKR